ncbi:dihydropteroate synthase [Nocardia sp. CA2R105]|uniref:dihydropteroate synthase n=1 Tax=Nocardia coffeae TaxID=2873381 RepID=UPI001CA6C0E5|nr:dihydropteroate synthase [Nocardia coffeae]MBY8859217.1 dihydropteroate synthase [Nocardia coffeae]
MRNRESEMKIVGIVNVTPDSFSDGGRYAEHDDAIARGLELAAQGADIIDVGGESTRPGAMRVDSRTQRRRVIPVICELAAHGVAVSVDTTLAEVAEAAVRAGATMINDVSGGEDPDIFRVVRRSGHRYVVTHSHGPSGTLVHYDDVVTDVREELLRRIARARAAGVRPEQIVIDPGLGFSKSAAENWAILARLDTIATIGAPVLVGASRKRFVAAVAGSSPDTAELDIATAAVSSHLAAAGVAWAVRVHDVTATAIAREVGSQLYSPAPEHDPYLATMVTPERIHTR